jgi:NAD(P) transhydrogenase subunit alpha
VLGGFSVAAGHQPGSPLTTPDAGKRLLTSSIGFAVPATLAQEEGMPQVFVPKEVVEGETRVACTPETTKRYVNEGFDVLVESDAGKHAHFTDEHYRDAGATIVAGAEAESAWGSADIVFRVYPITPEEASKIREGAILIGFMSPHKP